MSSYYSLVNLDKRQVVYPDNFGSGLKLPEIMFSKISMMPMLALLLTDITHEDSSYFDDLPAPVKKLFGSWAGNKLFFAGDSEPNWTNFSREEFQDMAYDIDGAEHRFGSRFDPKLRKWTASDEEMCWNMYTLADALFEDISDKVLQAVALASKGTSPFVTVDLAELGWRTVPNRNPKKPVGGKKLLKIYTDKKVATSERLLGSVMDILGER